MAENTSFPLATHFGHQVTKARRARGMSIHELSRISEISAGHLSKIENGIRPPTERIAEAMDGAFPERKGWFTDFYNDSQNWTPPGYRRWAEYENKARQIWAWSPGVLDGLVQCPKYAEAHLKTVPGVPAEIVKARLDARMERQNRILDGEIRPAVWVLVDELSLFRMVGSADIMAEQMEALRRVSSLPQVTLQVVPATAHAITGAVLIVTPDASYTEHLGSGAVYIEPETVTDHARLITTIQAESYRASESEKIIERVQQLWESGESPLTALLRAERASK